MPEEKFDRLDCAYASTSDICLCLGATMIPISWTEMQCPLTGQTEQRKVAKVTS